MILIIFFKRLKIRRNIYNFTNMSYTEKQYFEINSQFQTQNSKEEEYFLDVIKKTIKIYFELGSSSRSSKKVNCIHEGIVDILLTLFSKEKGYTVKMEQNIQSHNFSEKKKCDIVILKNNTPFIVFPVKFSMSSYKKNRNNYLENLTGELYLMKAKNPNLNIIPINIIMDKVPTLDGSKKIKNFEHIYTDNFIPYNILVKNKLCYDMINYIVEVEHSKKENELFDNIQSIKQFKTQYRSFKSILKDLL